MVMITLDIPKEINKKIEHFKIERELKDKRDAILMLLKQSVVSPEDLVKMKRESYGQRISQFQKLFKEADKTKRHNLTPEQIEAMDGEIYD